MLNIDILIQIVHFIVLRLARGTQNFGISVLDFDQIACVILPTSKKLVEIVWIVDLGMCAERPGLESASNAAV